MLTLVHIDIRPRRIFSTGVCSPGRFGERFVSLKITPGEQIVRDLFKVSEILKGGVLFCVGGEFLGLDFVRGEIRRGSTGGRRFCRTMSP